MVGLDIKAVQYFSLCGEKVRVSLSSSAIYLHWIKSRWRQDKCFAITLHQIVSIESRKSNKISLNDHKLLNSIRLGISSFCLFKRGYRTFDKQYEAIGNNTKDEDSIAIHYVEEVKSKGLLKLKEIILEHTDSGVVREWCRSLQSLVTSLVTRPRTLLVFINPFGGRGRATQTWEEKILPIFELAGINSQVIVTQHANHALSLLQTLPLHGYDGVVSVGGDGMFAEVFNGVTIRAAREAGLDINDKAAQFVSPAVRVGFIPGGSTDSVSMCLHGTTDPVTACLHIVLGHRMMVDTVSIHSRDRLERFAMTMVSYGYFGDLMTHSEEYRWLGRSRYSFSGVRTFLANKAYPGTVRYVADDQDQAGLVGERCGEGCPSCYQEHSHQDRDRSDDLDTEEVRENEVVGRFLAVSSATLSCSCPHTVPGLSPSAHTGDGTTDLIIVHKTPHINFLRYLFRTAFHYSHPFTLPFVTSVRVRSWSFTPQNGGPCSSWNCDGEIMKNVEIFVRSHRQLVPVFARGVYNKKFETERKLSEEAEMFYNIPAF